jgi:hypothetical protein
MVGWGESSVMFSVALLDGAAVVAGAAVAALCKDCSGAMSADQVLFVKGALASSLCIVRMGGGLTAHVALVSLIEYLRGSVLIRVAPNGIVHAVVMPGSVSTARGMFVTHAVLSTPMIALPVLMVMIVNTAIVWRDVTLGRWPIGVTAYIMMYLGGSF